MSNIIIKPQDQSAPKEHWADKEIKKAAEEIDGGRYTPRPGSEEAEAAGGMGIALGMGSGGVATGQTPALEEFQRTYEENQSMAKLGSHPRVLEAMDKMRHEVEETKGHELIEKNAMLRELVQASEAKNRWDGQGRWMGFENEESRYGLILSPQQFYDRLGKVVGKGKIKLSEHVVFPFPGAKSGLSGMYVKNPLWDGAEEVQRVGQRREALKMADAAQALWAEAQGLAKINQHSKADQKMKEVAALVAEAKGMYDQACEESIREPELLRVASIQWPLTTEWMIMEFTEWGTVCKPKFYGWRTALLTMLRAKVITETQAHKAFPVGTGPAAEWYLQQIYDMKLLGGSVN